MHFQPETAHLTLEQKRILRAKRNRESAEKSRNRRKLQTETLEKSVAQLRDENRELSAEMLKLQTQLESLSSEVAQAMTVGHEQEGLRERTPALYDAIEAVQKVMIDCPRTFLRSSHTPEIQLKIHKQRKKK